KYLLVAGACLLVAAACLACLGQDRAQVVQARAQAVETRIKEWISEGKNPAPALMLMKEAGEGFKAGQPGRGESLINQAMKFLETAQSKGVYTGPQSRLYENPQLVEIAGYAQDAMEPCISLDGKYLFFNNSNERPDTTIFCARRVSKNQFQYV